jgi:hypothetical protein
MTITLFVGETGCLGFLFWPQPSGVSSQVPTLYDERTEDSVFPCNKFCFYRNKILPPLFIYCRCNSTSNRCSAFTPDLPTTNEIRSSLALAAALVLSKLLLSRLLPLLLHLRRRAKRACPCARRATQAGGPPRSWRVASSTRRGCCWVVNAVASATFAATEERNCSGDDSSICDAFVEKATRQRWPSMFSGGVQDVELGNTTASSCTNVRVISA